MPVRSEEKSIIPVLKGIEDAMNRSRLSYEIIVVNDGSSAKVVDHGVNRGYGASLKTGISNAQYDIIVITDADGTYPNDRIPELVSHMKDYDMVVGARTGINVKIPLIRKPAKLAINRLANYLTGVKILDLNSDLRVMKKTIVNKFVRLLPDQF